MPVSPEGDYWEAHDAIDGPCDVVTLMLAAESALAAHLRAVADTMTWPEEEAEEVTADLLIDQLSHASGIPAAATRKALEAMHDAIVGPITYAKLPDPDPKFTAMFTSKVDEYMQKATAAFGHGARTELVSGMNGNAYWIICSECKSPNKHSDSCAYLKRQRNDT
jgi:hypothetical protein